MRILATYLKKLSALTGEGEISQNLTKSHIISQNLTMIMCCRLPTCSMGMGGYHCQEEGEKSPSQLFELMIQNKKAGVGMSSFVSQFADSLDQLRLGDTLELSPIIK